MAQALRHRVYIGFSRTILYMETKRNNRTRVCFAVAGALVVASGVLMCVFSQFSGALFPAYRVFSRTLISLQAAVASAAPFALWDMLALVAIVIAIVTLIRRIRRKRGLSPWLSKIAVVLSALLFVFVGGWALNHYAPALADDIGMQVHESTKEELEQATRSYLIRAAELASSPPRADDASLEKQDFYELAAIAGNAYTPLASKYDVFSGGSTAPVKSLLLWGEPLLYSGYVGIFFSPTAESCVPLNCAASDMPYTMCHEVAHRLGIASEEEANFAAILACDASQDARFKYAGYFNAFVYCYSALSAIDAPCASQLLEELGARELAQGVSLVKRDMLDASAYYERYAGAASSVGTAVNDGYLKTFGQDEGARSYGLVVDYLIAWNEAHA